MSFLFGSKAQRTFKRIQDLASSDMVDQAAVMVEEELETLLGDHDIASRLVPFLMDIGHPDLGGRIGEKVIRTHSDLRMTVTRLLEEKQAQFPRSIELLRVIWKNRLHQRDFNGLMDILGRTERVTVSRFADSVQSSAQALNKVTGRELGAGIERILAWAVITLHRGDPSSAMDVLVDAADRCRFPEESLSRLSGWIAARTGGADMDVNLKRIQILAAIGDRERAISELPSLYEAEKDILNKAVSLVEKELVPNDKTQKAKVSLARLMARAERVNEACLILDPLIEAQHDSSILEQAVTSLVIGSSGSARVHLLQARLRLFRGEKTQALDSVERAFSCSDVVESPVVDICRSFIESGIDRDGLITGKLGEFLVEKGTVDEAVKVLALSVDTDPEWVFEKLQQLLKRDRTSAAVLALLAVVMLVLGRGGEAAATLKHLSARQDVKSRQDIVSVLSGFDSLMDKHKELRRLRAASGAGRSSDSAKDWIELLLGKEKVGEDGCLAIYDSGVYKERAAEIVESSFEPASPAGELVLAAAKIESGDASGSTEHLIRAIESPPLVDRVTGLVSSLPFSAVAAMKPGRLLSSLNTCGRGDVVARLLPLLAAGGSEQWMDDLASNLVLGSHMKTASFRIRYFIETGKPGTGAAAVRGLNIEDECLSSLVKGCTAFAAGNMEEATPHLSRATSCEETASLARTLLTGVTEREKGSATGAIALAHADINTGNAKDAAEALKPLLREKEVLSFLEEAVEQASGAHELHGCLALARLFAGNPEGYREAAGTALEGDSGMAEELVERGAEYSLANSYAAGMVFAAEIGLQHIQNFDPSELLIKAVCLEPALHGRVEALNYRNDFLGMLLSMASGNPAGFQAYDIPDSVVVPREMVTDAHLNWKKHKVIPALIELEKLAVSAGYGDEAHEIKKTLSEASEERSDELLSDALEKEDWRMDFFALCSSSETAGKSIGKLFPGGLENAGKEAVGAAAEMLLRCGAMNALYEFALELIKTGNEEHSGTASMIVGVYLPTAGEDGSLAVSQVVELLLVSGRISEAFSLARGDSSLLAKVRKKVSETRAGSSSPRDMLISGRVMEIPADAPPMVRGEALWRTGDRRAACGVWNKAYNDTADPLFLVRLGSAFECMGAVKDLEAVRRILAEKHPEHLLRAGRSESLKSRLDLITYTIR